MLITIDVYNHKSPCLGCTNEHIDKSICLDGGCKKPAEWHDSKLDADELHLLRHSVRNRQDEAPYKINSGSGRSGRGGAE